jgi:uncharacterized repeat protein (TIGR04042 family)
VPEMTFSVRWPDGRTQDCYSPSLVVHDHLEPGTRYTVDDFTARSTHALGLASDRVRAAYGMACTSAMATVAQIRRSAAAYGPQEVVEVVRMHPPLPWADAADVAS